MLIAVFTAVAVVAAVFSWRESQRARQADFSHVSLGSMYSPDLRRARHDIYGLKTLETIDMWSDGDKENADTVAVSFEHIGFLMHARYGSPSEFLDFWAQVIVRSYACCEPMITRRRNCEGVAQHFVHFEWLARQAELRLEASEGKLAPQALMVGLRVETWLRRRLLRNWWGGRAWGAIVIRTDRRWEQDRAERIPGVTWGGSGTPLAGGME